MSLLILLGNVSVTVTILFVLGLVWVFFFVICLGYCVLNFPSFSQKLIFHILWNLFCFLLRSSSPSMTERWWWAVPQSGLGTSLPFYQRLPFAWRGHGVVQTCCCNLVRLWWVLSRCEVIWKYWCPVETDVQATEHGLWVSCSTSPSTGCCQHGRGAGAGGSCCSICPRVCPCTQNKGIVVKGSPGQQQRLSQCLFFSLLPPLLCRRV